MYCATDVLTYKHMLDVVETDSESQVGFASISGLWSSVIIEKGLNATLIQSWAIWCIFNTIHIVTWPLSLAVIRFSSSLSLI